MLKVLINAANSATSFATVRKIKANFDPIEIICLDVNDKSYVATSLFCDHFIQAPKAERTQECTQFFENIIDDFKIDICVPVLNNDFWIYNEIAKTRPNLCAYMAAQHELVMKDKIEALLNEKGVATPHSFKNASELQDQKEYFVKPINGFGSTGTKTLSGNQIKEIAVCFDTNIIQNVCAGPEITVDSFFDPDADFLVAICRERIETKVGVSTKCRIFADTEITNIAKSVALAIKQRGSVCFQLMRDSRGWVLVDLNLRTGGATEMCEHFGADFISASFALFTAQPYEKFLVNSMNENEIVVCRQYQDFRTK